MVMDLWLSEPFGGSKNEVPRYDSLASVFGHSFLQKMQNLQCPETSMLEKHRNVATNPGGAAGT